MSATDTSKSTKLLKKNVQLTGLWVPDDPSPNISMPIGYKYAYKQTLVYNGS